MMDHAARGSLPRCDGLLCACRTLLCFRLPPSLVPLEGLLIFFFLFFPPPFTLSSSLSPS